MRRTWRSSVPGRGASGVLTAVVTFAVSVGAAGAPTLVVIRDGVERVLTAESVRGFPAVGLRELAGALGYAWNGEAIEVDSRRVEFVPGSPFFHVGREVHQLASPPYRSGDALMLPVQWATEWLPANVPHRWRYADARLIAVESAPSRTASSAGPPATPGRRSRWVVVIDPGHGGVDPGSIGPRGTREKDVALGIARELAAALRNNGSIDVVLTRNTDTLIALADRPRIANLANGDLFISIHANAHKHRRSVSGFETYFLAVAQTEDAARVAQMENAAARYETGKSAKELDPITFMLRDLVQNAYLIESLRWAELVQGTLGGNLDAPNRGVKQAGFYVLVGTNMPAVLVEVGYITNAQEEMLLRSQAYQRRVARALGHSIERYLAIYGDRLRYAGEAR